MKIIAFTGLHGTGKSYIAKIIAKKMGILYVNKRALLKEMHEKNKSEYEKNWEDWYRELYIKHGGNEMMKEICSFIKIKYSNPDAVVIDSIHNPNELLYIQQKHATILILTVAPVKKRIKRVVDRDGMQKKDTTRIKAIHDFDEKGTRGCLYAQADWAICNYSDDSFLNYQIEELVSFVEESLQFQAHD